MTSVYSAFVNEGNMVIPYIEFDEKAKVQTKKIFEKEVADTIKYILIQVVNDERGTGYSAKSDEVLIAGKTGTAEIKADQNDENGTELGWFNAFIADENNNKQILIVSMVEDVKNRGGSHYVVPKVKTIIEEYIKN